MLAHVRDLAADLTGKVTDRLLAAGEALEDAQPLGIGQGPADSGKALALEIGRLLGLFHAANYIT